MGRTEEGGPLLDGPSLYGESSESQIPHALFVTLHSCYCTILMAHPGPGDDVCSIKKAVLMVTLC